MTPGVPNWQEYYFYAGMFSIFHHRFSTKYFFGLSLALVLVTLSRTPGPSLMQNFKGRHISGLHVSPLKLAPETPF